MLDDWSKGRMEKPLSAGSCIMFHADTTEDKNYENQERKEKKNG